MPYSRCGEGREQAMLDISAAQWDAYCPRLCLRLFCLVLAEGQTHPALLLPSVLQTGAAPIDEA